MQMRHCLAGGMIINSEALCSELLWLHKPGDVWTPLLALYCLALSSNLTGRPGWKSKSLPRAKGYTQGSLFLPLPSITLPISFTWLNESSLYNDFPVCLAKPRLGHWGASDPGRPSALDLHHWSWGLLVSSSQSTRYTHHCSLACQQLPVSNIFLTVLTQCPNLQPSVVPMPNSPTVFLLC